MATISYDVRRIALPVAAALLLTGCSGDDSSDAGPTPTAAPDDGHARRRQRAVRDTHADRDGAGRRSPSPTPYPVSLPAFFEREPDGGDLRLGAVRERTAGLHVVRRVVPQRPACG